MRRHAPLLALLLLLFISPVVTAQSTIDRGTVNFTGSYILSPLAQFRFQGPQLMTLTGTLRTGLFYPQCGPCVGGQQASIGSTISESSSVPGTLTTGIETRSVYFEASLNFVGLSVTLPFRYSRLPFKITVPITAQGVLRVYGSDPFNNSSDLLFVFPVNLLGKATVTFKLQGLFPSGQPYYQVLGTTYEFPLPEKTGEN